MLQVDAFGEEIGMLRHIDGSAAYSFQGAGDQNEMQGIPGVHISGLEIAHNVLESGHGHLGILVLLTPDGKRQLGVAVAESPHGVGQSAFGSMSQSPQPR